ncbi:MAG: hypothetical protein Q8R44_01920 [Novosphingobium sp.]|nr:hypothetical protein [Novosphingobium sp.]
MIVALRRFLTATASSRPDEAAIAALTENLDDWSLRLQACHVEVAEQVYARRPDLVGRG